MDFDSKPKSWHYSRINIFTEMHFGMTEKGTENIPIDEGACLEGLNEEQKKAVIHGSGPLLIVAGAGTGKTMAITRRIAWLIATGKAKPEELLALTFTDKAAGEMVERVDALLPMGYVDLWISTFHSFCQRILQAHGLDIGLPNDFRLLNETDAYLLVRQNMDKFDLDYYRPLGNPNKFIYALLKHFSRAKDEAVGPKEYLDYAKDLALDKDRSGTLDAEDVSREQELAGAYHVYQKLLLDNACIDLGDLLLYTLQLFDKRKNILEKYSSQFKYVIVDEFQDTNWAQYELLKKLVGRDGNIVVVGDDDQSIYKFRGASISNILQFKSDFPAAKEVVLTRNYRSRQNILDLAYSFIQQNNPNRLEVRLAGSGGEGSPEVTKRLVAEKEGEAVIEHMHFRAADDEVVGVMGKMLDLKEGGSIGSWSDLCILVRSNHSADAFSSELQRRGVPYQFLALKGLYTKPTVLDCLSYFRLLDDYHESAALYRVLTSPVYHVTGGDLVAMTHEAKRSGASLYAVLQKHSVMTGLQDDTHRTIDRLLSDIERHAQTARSANVSEVLVRFLYDSGYAELLKKDDTFEARERVSFLKQFLDRIRRFESMHDSPTLKHFMEEFELERESGNTGGLNFDIESGPDMVRIMTIHAAKGLESPHVFLVNMVAQRFPSVNRGGEIELPLALTKEEIPEGDIHLEEERRLCYVAMTRAMDGLYFTSAEDYGGKTRKKPSRFLEELGFVPAEAERAREAISAPDDKVVPTKPPYILPKYFSYTQLAAYANCSLQYKYAHILRIPVLGNYQMSFGKTMHTVLEKFVSRIMACRSSSQAQLFDSGSGDEEQGLPVSKEELLRMYEESWINEWYPDNETREKYRQEGKESLCRVHDEMSERPPDTIYLEQDFKLKIGKYWIRGKIDRVDRIGDEVEVIDYKTGAPKKEGRLGADEKRQLLLYQLAVERLLDLKPGRLTFKYLRDGSSISFIGSPEELVKFELDVGDRIDDIRSGDFRAKPGPHCKFCDFRNICEFRNV